MKLALIILGLFFLSLTARSRELTLSEKVVVLNFKKSHEVKSFMETKIKKNELSMRDYVGFLALRKSCDPIELFLKHLDKQDDSFADQSKKMAPLMAVCQNGVLGLSHLYIGQQD